MANASTSEAASAGVLLDTDAGSKLNRVNHLWRVWRKKPAGLIGGILIAVFLFVGIFAPYIAPYASNEFAGNVRVAPNGTYLFGTDQLGRDTLSRTIYGAQISLAAGLTATIIAVTAATFFATLGYFGGWVDNMSQRLLEILSSFPSIVLALVFIAVFGRANSTSTNLLVIAWDLRALEMAIGLTFVFGVTRVLRAAVIRERGIPYIEAARSIGAPATRILWRHILPNIMPYIIVSFSSLIGAVILIEASLSFLGYGVAPGVPSWGGDLSTRNRDYFLIAPWLLIAPGVALSLLVIGYNFFGDALRDILDPRLRGS